MELVGALIYIGIFIGGGICMSFYHKHRIKKLSRRRRNPPPSL